MQQQAGILDLLRRQGEQALKRSCRAVIIQPGSIGDCILTLPLARFIKEHLKVGAVDMIGRADYISYFTGRTCIDTIRSIDSIEMHRLFRAPADFQLTQRDALIDAFAGYSWIISFLGTPQSDFEQNLIFTANCSQSVEIIIVPLQPPSSHDEHIASRYIRHLSENCSPQITYENPDLSGHRGEPLIQPTNSDRKIGERIIHQAGIDTAAPLIVLCPGSGGSTKCWYLSNFLAVAQQLKSAGAEPLILLGPAELERFSPRQLIDISRTAVFLAELSLTEVLQILSAARAFVGNDSGITHLAAAIGLDTVALFGPTSDPATYRPLGPNICLMEDKTPAFSSGPSQALQRRVMEKLGEFCA